MWVFTLADERDFSKNVKSEELKFTASHTYASYEFRRFFSVVLRDVHIESKKGFIDMKWYKYYSKIFLREENDFIPSTDDDPVLMELNLKTDLSSIVKIRMKYQSISDLVAFLGGFSKGLSLFLFVLVFPFREIKYYRKLINSMFSVCMTPN
jgi:hypothetical protein